MKTACGRTKRSLEPAVWAQPRKLLFAKTKENVQKPYGTQRTHELLSLYIHPETRKEPNPTTATNHSNPVHKSCAYYLLLTSLS